MYVFHFLSNFKFQFRQAELLNEIQGKVNTLSDSALEQIFEVSTTKEKLKETIKALNDDLAKTVEKDKLFMQYAGSFSRRVD